MKAAETRYWRDFFGARADEAKPHHVRIGQASAAIARMIETAVRARIGAVSGLRLLDAGCGDGQITAPTAGGNAVVGLDFSPPMLCLARRRGLVPVCADLTALPFAPDSFDIAVCAEAMTCLPQPLDALDGLARAVKPGGRLIVTGLNAGSPLRRLARGLLRALHVRQPELIDPEDCLRALRGSGLQTAPVQWLAPYLGGALGRSGRLDRLLATNFLIEATKPVA
ncbi:MAG TPA: class I SAM-dependent methyltransferase [Dongiaceae bacterium]|nr:class I SAM-dependent methyltransferase [Dongiaceae bacterium]